MVTFDPYADIRAALKDFDPSAAARAALQNFDPHAIARAALDGLKDFDASKLLSEALSKIDFTLGLADLPRYDGMACHYTTRRGLEGIVQDKAFRASEATQMNDLSEITHGWQLIDDWLAEQPDDEAVQLLRESIPSDKGAAGVFVLSASEVLDDAHQWRAYADDARGFAIGIDCASELLPVAPVPADEDPFIVETTSVEQWRKVMYRKDDARTALDHLLASIHAKGLAARSGASDEETVRALVRSRTASLLTTIAHLIKHPGFEGEKEVRLVATGLGRDHVRYLGPDGSFGAYIEVASAIGASKKRQRSAPMPPVSQLPIISVRIGPRLAPVTQLDHRDVLTARLSNYLAEHELGAAAVEASSIPLR